MRAELSGRTSQRNLSKMLTSGNKENRERFSGRIEAGSARGAVEGVSTGISV